MVASCPNLNLAMSTSLILLATVIWARSAIFISTVPSPKLPRLDCTISPSLTLRSITTPEAVAYTWITLPGTSISLIISYCDCAC